MKCQKCERRNNGICGKYDRRLVLKSADGDLMEFEEVEECEIKPSC